MSHDLVALGVAQRRGLCSRAGWAWKAPITAISFLLLDNISISGLLDSVRGASCDFLAPHAGCPRGDPAWIVCLANRSERSTKSHEATRIKQPLQSFSLSIHSRTYEAQCSSFTPCASQLMKKRTMSRSITPASFRSRTMSRQSLWPSKSLFYSAIACVSIRPLRMKTVNLPRAAVSILKVMNLPTSQSQRCLLRPEPKRAITTRCCRMVVAWIDCVMRLTSR